MTIEEICVADWNPKVVSRNTEARFTQNNDNLRSAKFEKHADEQFSRAQGAEGRSSKETAKSFKRKVLEIRERQYE